MRTVRYGYFFILNHYARDWSSPGYDNDAISVDKCVRGVELLLVEKTILGSFCNIFIKQKNIRFFVSNDAFMNFICQQISEILLHKNRESIIVLLVIKARNENLFSFSGYVF